jgi:drug/metabolite transporter (DMT)-like permease
LLRYLVASLCMGIIYWLMPKSVMTKGDKCKLLGVGIIGLGVYNIALNYSELTISSGTASFVISQSPLVTVIFAVIFLGERLSIERILGFIISVIGVTLIAFGENGAFKWEINILYILIATIVGGLYSVWQKPFLKKYHAIEATTYIVWGATLFLLLYTPYLQHDFMQASFKSTLVVAYLGIFPAAVGYLAWAYVLSEISALRASSFIYFMPFLTIILGWLYLGEVPAWLSIAGGVLALFGVWLVNQSYVKVSAASEMA